MLAHSKAGRPLLDVRSPKEFTGEKLHMEDYPQEGALRGGHIPGAVNVPWSRAVNEDGTFKSAEELKAIYRDEVGLKPGDDIVAYCRIGERSSLTWFVLTYLLGYAQGPQLRRVLVRVGQPRPRPDRQGGVRPSGEWRVASRTIEHPSYLLADLVSFLISRTATRRSTTRSAWPPSSKRSSRN